jgi:NAD(P)H-dependent FMN reductase
LGAASHLGCMTDDTADPRSVRVAAICGSLREESATRASLRHALDAAADRGATTDLIDLRALDLPIYDADEDPAGDASELTRRVREADAVLVGTPMYHGSYSSTVKTAIDYCGFDEFESKTVGLLAVSGGRFPVTALEHLRSVFRALDAWVLPHQAAVPHASEAVETGELVDEGLADRVAALGRRAVDYSAIKPDPHSFESEENVGAQD